MSFSSYPTENPNKSNIQKKLGVTFIFALILLFFVGLYVYFTFSKALNVLLEQASIETPITAPLAPEPVAPKEALKPLPQTIVIGQGDTLINILRAAGISSSEAHLIIKATSSLFDPKKFKPGNVLSLIFKPEDADAPLEKSANKTLLSLTFSPDPSYEIIVSQSDLGDYSSARTNIELNTVVKRQSNTITNSLVESALAVNIPYNIINDFIIIKSHEVDFQRDIHPNDTFEILYEAQTNSEGEIIKSNKILYCELTLSNKKSVLYYFEEPTLMGGSGYFDEKGQSASRSLMRTPTNSTRLSSPFGNRRHPILGYTKKHKGVDFAAPRGTPVYAAGNGVIESIGRNGSYGLYIRIRHNSEFKTAYAHLNSFAKSLKRNSRVKQGSVIAYVGSSGRSTGPHLHYEIIKNGRHVNPQTVKLAVSYVLNKTQLKTFQAQKTNIETLRSSRPIVN